MAPGAGSPSRSCLWLVPVLSTCRPCPSLSLVGRVGPGVAAESVLRPLCCPGPGRAICPGGPWACGLTAHVWGSVRVPVPHLLPTCLTKPSIPTAASSGRCKPFVSQGDVTLALSHTVGIHSKLLRARDAGPCPCRRRGWRWRRRSPGAATDCGARSSLFPEYRLSWPPLPSCSVTGLAALWLMVPCWFAVARPRLLRPVLPEPWPSRSGAL